MDIRSFAMQMLSNSPQVANNPQAREMIQVIQNGDSQKGEQIARNLCNTYGVSPEEATQQAKKFFGFGG